MWLNVGKFLCLLIWIAIFAVIGNKAFADDKPKDITCHKGPHRIEVAVPGPCPNGISCSLTRGPDNTYYENCVTNANECFVIEEKVYTDYPECGGQPTPTDLEALCANKLDPMLCLLRELDRVDTEA